MNSLAYLSRQFDVLASPKTPNSTPTSEHSSFLSDKHTPASQQNSSLKRVSTWSTKSLFFSPSSRHVRASPRSRSASSPDFVTLASQTALISPASPSLESQTRPVSKLETVIKRIFFIRVFAFAWDALCATWTSLKRTGIAESKREIVGQPVSTRETKDRTTNEERVPLLQQTPPTPPPPLPPALPTGPHTAFNQSHPEPPESKTELSSSYLSVTSSTSSIVIAQSTDLPAGASRASTPSLPARKTPFHLPKTLVLDLDETLIHSTSRPLFSSVSGGSGLLGIGTFGNRNKGTGHMVEVVLGGRSTIYHVYKRPFVDFFLRTVSIWMSSQSNRLCLLRLNYLGFGMVHTCHLHRVHARIRGPRH